MPMAIPLLAAAGTVAAGVAAGATTFVGGLMIAGGVMTGLGALTGNKKLSQLGGIVSLAGGVTGLMNGAWSSAADSVVQQAGESVAPLAESAAQAGDAVASASGSLEDAATQFTSGDAGHTGIIDAVKNHTPDLVPGTGGGSYNPGAGVNPPGITQGVGASSAMNGPLDRAGYAMKDAAGGIIDKAKDFGSWIEKNPTTAKMAGGIVGGAMDSISKQKQLQMEADLAQQQWQKRRDIINSGSGAVHAPVYVPPPPRG